MGKIFYKGVDYSSPTSSGVSGVKGNKETSYRVGNVNITPANVGALAENGDSKDNTVTFTSNDNSTSDAWTDVAVLATGEKHSSLFAKISTMFKNIRYIYTHFIKSENILDTLEEIVANTQSGKVAGALAVKELNSNFEKSNMICKTITVASNTMTFSLRYSGNESLRLPVMVFAVGQNGYVGLYSISVFYNEFAINIINGSPATITDNGNGTITITFQQSNIWGTGFIIAPKSII